MYCKNALQIAFQIAQKIALQKRNQKLDVSMHLKAAPTTNGHYDQFKNSFTK